LSLSRLPRGAERMGISLNRPRAKVCGGDDPGGGNKKRELTPTSGKEDTDSRKQKKLQVRWPKQGKKGGVCEGGKKKKKEKKKKREKTALNNFWGGKKKREEAQI